MSTPVNCQSSCCPTVENTQTPGPEGAPGTNGTNGVDGAGAFTLTTAAFVVPAIAGAVTVTVANSNWMVTGMNLFITGAGYFVVTSVPDSTHVALTYLAYAGNTNAGNLIALGAGVATGGTEPAIGALPNVLTIPAGLTASDVIAAGVGVSTLVFFITASVIANGDLLTDYVPGYAFKILKFDARCAAPVTTGAKASALNLEIGAVNVNGGVISLAGAYILGAAQAGTAIAAANVGTATDAISIEASATTAFTEGAFWLTIAIQNLDTANAVASLATHTNSILAALP